MQKDIANTSNNDSSGLPVEDFVRQFLEVI